MKKTIGGVLLISISLTACASDTHQNIAANAPIEKPIVRKDRSVECVSQALKALRASEYQGGARYAKKNIETSYNILNQAINMIYVTDSATVCATAQLAEKEANMALYIAVSAESRAGIKKMKPKPLRLNTAAPSAPRKKPQLIKASYEKKVSHPRVADHLQIGRAHV